ncbi:MAG: type II secretion system F family protein [Erysipelotrichaceae bacterium]
MSKMDDYKWLMLAKLIERYGSIRDSLQMLENMYPETKRIKEINQKSAEGIPLKDILDNDSFEKQLSFYIQYIDIKQAVRINYQKNRQKEKLKKQLIEKISYQIILLLSSIALLILFTETVLPNMMVSLELSSRKTDSIILTFKIINSIKNIVLIVIMILISLFVYIKVFKREAHIWLLFHKIGKDKMFKMIATYYLVNDLVVFLKNGLSLHQSLDILRFNKTNRLTALLAHHFNEALLKGSDFESSLDIEYFDDEFHSICLYGLKDDDFIQAINDYQQLSSYKFEQLIKKMSTVFQTICYLFVAVIIILAYQVLLMPLEILQDF